MKDCTITETENEIETEKTVDQKTKGTSPQVRKRVQDVNNVREACTKAIHADDLALALWERGKLDDKTFALVTGHTPTVALQVRYVEDRVNASFPLRRKVELGQLTEEEYETATGSGYVVDMENHLVRVVNELLGGVVGVPLVCAGETPEELIRRCVAEALAQKGPVSQPEEPAAEDTGEASPTPQPEA